MDQDIQNTVTTIIAAISGMKQELIKLDFTIAGPPLKIGNPDINYLAMALRGIIKSSNSGKTLKKSELTKSGMTVGQVVKLVESKLLP